jgi:hypothetical protein
MKSCCALSLFSLPSGIEYSIVCFIVLTMFDVYVPFWGLRCKKCSFTLQFPDPNLYIEFHRLEPAVWGQNSLKDLNLPSWSFVWWCLLPSWYQSLLSCLRLSSFLVLWQILLVSALIFEVLWIHLSTEVPLETRSPDLDTQKASWNVAFIMDLYFDISSSISLDCLTFLPSSGSHFLRSLELFTNWKLRGDSTPDCPQNIIALFQINSTTSSNDFERRNARCFSH